MQPSNLNILINPNFRVNVFTLYCKILWQIVILLFVTIHVVSKFLFKYLRISIQSILFEGKSFVLIEQRMNKSICLGDSFNLSVHPISIHPNSTSFKDDFKIALITKFSISKYINLNRLIKERVKCFSVKLV